MRIVQDCKGIYVVMKYVQSFVVKPNNVIVAKMQDGDYHVFDHPLEKFLQEINYS